MVCALLCIQQGQRLVVHWCIQIEKILAYIDEKNYREQTIHYLISMLEKYIRICSKNDITLLKIFRI